ncbi:MAG TPA: cation diffusion facilitator family transporter [Candidatus Atribacteria bacterium]|nr:cation diffusion facilitator family transporter [Candidatus Atribacteria bacterium]
MREQKLSSEEISSNPLASKAYYAKLEAWASILVNFILFGIKLYYGNLSQSLALTADAFETLSDVATSLAIFFIARELNRAPDREHPFGHGRLEDTTTLIIAVLLFVVGIQFLIQGYRRILHPSPIQFSLPALFAILIGIGGKEILAQIALFLGKKASNSELLIAKAWHHRSDALDSLPVLVVFLFPRYPWLDGVSSLFTSITIIWIASKILRGSVSRLLGRSISPQEREKILNIASQFKEVSNVHSIYLHDYGGRGVITMHIEVDGNLSVKEGHDLSEKMEKEIKNQTGFEGIVHVEPFSEEK